MSISKTPALCKAAKLGSEVLNGHMPEYNTGRMVEPDGIEPTT